MSAEARCERTDLLVSQCAHCRGYEEPSGRLDDMPPPTAWTVARYDGGCPGCHEPIRVGERIALCDETWVCEMCGEGAS